MKIKVSIWVLLFWLTLGVIYLLSLYLDSIRYQTGFQLTVPMAMTTILIYAAWAGLTVVLYYFLKEPVKTGNLWSCVLIFIIGMAVTMPLIVFIDHAIYAIFGQQSWPTWDGMFENTRYISMFFNAVLYVVVFIICGGFIYQQYFQEMKLKAMEISKQKSETEYKLVDMKMQALQSQLSPHFLFNCLNAISALTRMAEKTQVIKAIARLGDLLRYTVGASEKAFISLDEELLFIENYVSLQKLRLGDTFEFNMTCDEDIRSCVCPPFILHTLVENAIAHGANDQGGVLVVVVDINAVSDKLVFSVSNSTTPMSTSKPSNGLGLALDNLKSRLKMLYGDAYTISCEQQGKQFLATLKIPKDDEFYGSSHESAEVFNG